MSFHFAVLRLLFVLSLTALGLDAHADVKVLMESGEQRASAAFPSIPAPAINDAGARGTWSVLHGRADSNSASAKVLHDGRLASGDDNPSENFFFAAGTDGGSILVDLGSVQELTQVVTYSRHVAARAPQVFRVYGATGKEEGFSATSFDEKEPTQGGWKLLARVDTRALAGRSTQHAVSITDDQTTLGEVRYVRFDVSATENNDPFGNTFFSEIDILARGGPELKRMELAERKLLSFATSDTRYKFTIDTTVAPELHEWTEAALQPVIQTWYPKIVDMLPSEGFQAPQQVHFQYLPSDQMRGIPAWAQNGTISMNAGWFRNELNREARGAVVHEMVHVVQDYQRARGRRGAPGWIVEGIPDYIRWFLYEPESKGALLSNEALSRAKHDASYRTTANFIDWVIRHHDQGGDLLRRLNAAAREGKYSSQTWQELTGKSEQELADAWKNQPTEAK